MLNKVWTRHRWTAVTLILIVLVALALRLHGLNWDSGFGFHPDERDIYMRSGCMYEALTDAPNYQNCGYLQAEPETVPGVPSPQVFLDPERSPLNPHWFPLGSILVYVLVFFRSIVELFTDVSALDMRYVGRALSGLADVGSVLLIFMLGRRMYGTKVGLLGAALTALAVIHVQNSHFYRPETFSALFTLASFWALFRMMDRKGWGDSVVLGLLVGLAVSPKISGLTVVVPLAMGYGYRILDSSGLSQTRGRESWLIILAHGAAAVGVSAIVFFVASPYSFLDFENFSGDLGAQSNMVRNAGIWPFTIQYLGMAPFLYQIKQTAVFGLGLPLGVIAWLAIPFTVATLFWRSGRRRTDLLILAYLLVTLAVLESFEVRFQRYLFTLMPLMILLGSRMLFWLVDNGSATRNWIWPRSHGDLEISPLVPPWLRGLTFGLKWAPVGLLIAVVAATAFYSVAFQRVYARQHPAVSASQWINANIDRGTLIISDNHWDEFVPGLHGFDVWQYPVYEPDTRSKMETLAQMLADADYLVFYSNRPYTSVTRDPGRFPYSAAYYESLFAGDLGYSLEKSFTSYPSLWGVEFRDDPIGDAGLTHPNQADSAGKGAANGAPRGAWSFNLGYADDNVIGYDHPQVLLFRNVRGLSPEAVLDRLVRNQPRPGAGASGDLMLSEQDLVSQRDGGTWSQLIDRESWTNRLPVLAWLLLVELVYLAALPLSIYIFRPLPDRGIILARILGLLGVSYATWMLVSLGWVGFSRTAIVWGFLAVSAASVLVLVFRWRDIFQFLKLRWRLLVGVEALFLVAFLAFIALRAANPDLWHPWRGGEKPMELAYFNAVIRSTTMPPFDPWFSGGYLNYYYWGYFMPAALVRITGILPATAFNLAVPLFFALTVTGAFSLVYNLTEGVRRSLSGGAGDPAAKASRRPLLDFKNPIGAGLMGAIFIGVIGNLDGMVQIIQGFWSRFFQSMASFPAFDFWRSSRMIPSQENFDPSPLTFWVADKVADAPDMSFHITEFPFFTFLFADLHAHMMVIPFTLLVIALGLTMVVGLRREGWLWAALASLVLAVGLGSLWVINSWDYPSYLLLVLVLLGVAVYLRPGPARPKAGLLAILALLVVIGSIGAFLPFHQAYEVFNNGLEASKWRTPLDRYLGVFGLFLFIAVTFLLYELRREITGVVPSLRGGRLPIAAVSKGGLVALGPGLLLVLLAVAGYWTGAVLLAVLLGVAWAGWTLISSDREDKAYAVVPLVLLAMGLCISIGLDFVRVTGDIGRMNTLFKYYLEVWVLFSLAAAYMLWRLVESGFIGRMVPTARGVWLGVLLLLLGSSLIYTALGTRVRLSDRFDQLPVTLDGTAYMKTALHSESGEVLQLQWDLQAIEWLQDNVEGSPVVLEAHGAAYRWNARIASYTGLPTVLGWPWHQTQQRMAHAEWIAERAGDVARIYNTIDIDLAEELLRRYQVEYIVVGELEKIYYDAPGLEKFLLMEQQEHLWRVYQNGGVVIYRTPWR